MIIETLKELYSRDLNKLKKEIELYRHEDRIWLVEKSIANSGGNLCLHLIGNLNAYIGVGLAQTNYVRQRDLEFSLTDIPKATLIKKTEDTLLVVLEGLDRLSPERLKDDFPVLVWEQPRGMEFTLLHLLTHLNYHLGQINYHRRLLDE